MRGVDISDTLKRAQLSSQVSEIQRSASETNEQFYSLEVSIFPNTNNMTRKNRRRYNHLKQYILQYYR
jgi:hypothetical protein